MKNINNINIYLQDFEKLETFFEWDSRILKIIPGESDYLLMKLKPTIFSYKDWGVVELEGIDIVRTELNTYFCKLLDDNDIKTSTIITYHDITLIKKEIVPPIEVIVKSSMIWSPKHIYKNISAFETRFWNHLMVWGSHQPYVRFDFRNPLPHEDMCMPEWLADYFIDTECAKETVLKAFNILQVHLREYGLDLLDICFFMNESWDTITAEISTDNTNIVYTGNDQKLIDIFTDRSKNNAINKWHAILHLLNKSWKSW